jgi:hypothetical protein
MHLHSEEEVRDDNTDYTHQTDGGLVPPTAGYFADSADNLLLTPYQSLNPTVFGPSTPFLNCQQFLSTVPTCFCAPVRVSEPQILLSLVHSPAFNRFRRFPVIFTPLSLVGTYF